MAEMNDKVAMVGHLRTLTEQMNNKIKAQVAGLVQEEDGKGLSANDYTDTDKAKLDGITEGANKVEPSDTPGNIKINGVETSIFQVATDEEISAMLDEVLGLIDNRLIELEELKNMILARPEGMEVVLTGRVFQEELRPLADQVYHIVTEP